MEYNRAYEEIMYMVRTQLSLENKTLYVCPEARAYIEQKVPSANYFMGQLANVRDSKMLPFTTSDGKIIKAALLTDLGNNEVRWEVLSV